MAMYFRDGALVFRKLDTIIDEFGNRAPVYTEEVNILEDLQKSYTRYITTQIKEDVAYLEGLLHEYKEMSDVSISVKVHDLSRQSYTKTQVNNAKMFWSAYIQFYRSGVAVGPEHEMLRIPFMDAYGRLNVDGKIKSFVQEQRTAEDISYNYLTQTFNICTPTANIQVSGASKDVKIKYGGKSFSLVEIIMAMMYKVGDDTDLSALFTTTALKNKCKFMDGAIHQLAHDSLVARTNILDAYASKQYVLGDTRESLNEQLSLFRAVGERLSRDVAGYARGTVITRDMVYDLIYKRVHVIYVDCFTIPEGYYYANGYTPISFLPKGLPVTDLVVEHFPEYAQHRVLPEDVVIDDADKVIVLSDAEPLTEKEVEFYHNLFPESVLPVTAKRGGSDVISYSFEREIVDNYTAQLKYLVDVVPQGRYADEWVYYYNNPDLEPVDNSHLNCHDFIALLSLYGETLATGTVRLLDRDTAYLKKVQGICETFSEHLRRVLKSYVTRAHNSIYSKVSSGSESNPLAWLTKEWLKSMYEAKVLATPDTLNILAEVSQANHITTLSSSKEIPDEQRQIAMPYFGRLCPFETPAGKQLGLVNTKAVGARMRNGLLEVPCRKVIAIGKENNIEAIRLSSTITWMNVNQERNHKLGDIGSLQYDKSGEILNTHILARVPSPEGSREPFIFKNIRAFELAGEYVTAYPEQFLSSTVCMIPFAGADNVVRISYGSSQIRQAIYLLDSQVPLITTRMSKKIFDYYGTEDSICPVTGTIEKIVYPSQYVTIRKDNGELFSYCLNSLSPEDPWFMHGVAEYLTFVWRVKEGDHVTEGQVMAKVIKQPAHYVVKAPMSGYICDIHSETISIVDKQPSPTGFVDTDNDTGDTFPFVPVRVTGQTITACNLHVHVGQKVEEGQVLADTWASRDGFYTPARHPLVAYFSNGYNYEDAICATEKGCVNYTSIITHKADITKQKRGNASYRAGINGGMKYCAPGDTIGTIQASFASVVGVKETPTESNTHDIIVRSTLKEQGIPFEVNTVEDTQQSRTYRFHLLGFKKLHAGCKMAGRHGNKGVVSSKIFKNSEAPQLANGMTVEFILSPLGVPSRMNLGQILEVHLSLCAYILGVRMDSEPYNGATDEEISDLLQYTWNLANTPAIGDNLTGQYNRAVFDAVCSGFPDIPQEVHEIAWSNIANIIDWRGAFNPDGTARLYDPETESWMDGDVVIGFPEFFKLMQEDDEKLNVRSGPLEEDYAQNSMQPAKNENSAKGQRMGEMETVALASLGVSRVIDETLNELGDNDEKRTALHLKQLGITPPGQFGKPYSRAVENTLYYLEGMGVNLEVTEDIADVSSYATYNKYSTKLKKVIGRNFYRKSAGKESQSSDLSDVADE